MGKLPSGRTSSHYLISQKYEKGTDLQQTQQRVKQLRQELKDAELQEAIAGQTAVTHVVDTGSPVTIVSITCLFGYSWKIKSLYPDYGRVETTGTEQVSDTKHCS